MSIVERDATTAITTPTPTTDPPVARASTQVHWTGADDRSPWLLEARALVPRLAADAEHFDRTGTFNHGAFEAFRDHRLMSMLVPRDLGGGGATHAEAAAVLAELAHGCPATSLALSMHTHLVAAQVWRHHRALPAPVLARVAAEQIVLVSTGAVDWIDSSGIATRVDGGFRIRARKSPSSAGPAGDVLVTSARWDDGPDGPQVVHVAVSFTADGVGIEPTWDAIGMRASGSDTVVLDDVFVADAAVSLVRPQEVWPPVWNTVIGAALPLIMATYVGLAESAVERALRLAGRRAERPDTAVAVGRMMTTLTTARDAVRAMIDASDDLHFDNDVGLASTVLARKSVAAQAVIDTVRLAFEAGGGSAYATSSDLGRLLRDGYGALYHPLPPAQQERFTGRVALGLPPLA